LVCSDKTSLITVCMAAIHVIQQTLIITYKRRVQYLYIALNKQQSWMHSYVSHVCLNR